MDDGEHDDDDDDDAIGTGGDDVSQLCEAGEEEFLEIMALVGMASKPLHVRRLQKALLEWIVEPGLSVCHVLLISYRLHCVLASGNCNRSCLFVCVYDCGFVGLLPR